MPLPPGPGTKLLLEEAAAVDFVRDAFLKVIGHSPAAAALLQKGSIVPDAGVIGLDAGEGVAAFIEAAKGRRLWTREPTSRSPG